MKKKKSINKKDSNQLFLSIINRERLVYSSRMIYNFALRCLCFRGLGKLKHGYYNNYHRYFEKAQSKLNEELDIVNIVKSVKNLRAMSQAVLSQRDRFLLKF